MRASDDLDLLTEAARVAGRIAARHWRADVEAWDKPGGEGPVTDADIEVDRTLREMLLAERPSYGWLSEETEDSSSRLSAERVFIVDPIDGTRAFIKGERSFSHSLAVAQNGRIVAAVVFLPMLDRLFSAAEGQGATLNDIPLNVGQSGLEGANLLGPARDFKVENWPGGLPPVHRHSRPSLAYRLCLVAQGRFDAMLTLRPTWEWDVAAGSLIAQEAGAIATDRHGRAPLFNATLPRIDGVIVANEEIHKGLRARMLQPE